MTKYFYDCEFVEDGHTIDLVSIGIVADDGREYYAVSREFDVVKLLANRWLRDNVWPYLPQTDDGRDVHHFDPAVKPRQQIAAEVQTFLMSGEGRPELWSWYGAYDHVALCQLFGPMVDLPMSLPMWTNDIRQEQRRLGDPGMPPQRAKEHHALADAHYHRELFEYLRTLDVGP